MAPLAPLAERMRPRDLEHYLGQGHLVGKGAVLHNAIAQGRIPSMILWGPPGVGKTTLALIIAETARRSFFKLSAINSGVKEIREVIEKAEKLREFEQQQPILFIDEIHRFSKSQQDSLLGAVERGTITLIGATTENPSFEVISALLSRCQVYVLQPLDEKELIGLLHTTLENDEVFRHRAIEIKEYEALLRLSGGDARRLLNVFELVVNSAGRGQRGQRGQRGYRSPPKGAYSLSPINSSWTMCSKTWLYTTKLANNTTISSPPLSNPFGEVTQMLPSTGSPE